MQETETKLATADCITDMPTAVDKLKAPENNNTVIAPEDFLRTAGNPSDSVFSFPYIRESDSDNPNMKDKFKINSDFSNTFAGDLSNDSKRNFKVDHIQEVKGSVTAQEANIYEISIPEAIYECSSPVQKLHHEDDYYYRNSPNSGNESDSENRLKIDISDDDGNYSECRVSDTNKRRRSSQRDEYVYTCKFSKKDSPSEYQEMSSPTFQDNFINSMKISNSQQAEEIYRGEEIAILTMEDTPSYFNDQDKREDRISTRNSDADEFSWHPHVYAKPPKVPTPHSIVDILGWGLQNTRIHIPSPIRAISTPSPVYSSRRASAAAGERRSSPEVTALASNNSSIKVTTSAKANVLSQLMNVRRKDSSKHKADSKSKAVQSCFNNSMLMQRLEGQSVVGGGKEAHHQAVPSVGGFVSCSPVGGMHGGGLVAEQPLDLCVARGRTSSESCPSPIYLPQDLSKSSKKGKPFIMLNLTILA